MRYIGNKAKLVETIDDFLKNNNIEVEGKIFCDLFSGTATVADYFQDRCHIIVNDSLYFSYAISAGKVKHNDNFFKELGFCPFDFFNSQNTDQYKKGFCYNTFAPSKSGRQYFSDENAKKIDFIRDTIDKWFKNKMINDDEKLYLIGSLIESVSKVSNVAGVYSAYLKKWDPRAVKEMSFIPIEQNKKAFFSDNKAFFEDVNDILTSLEGDILYLDPPYTPTQYISQYHTLETIAKNDKPKIHGIGAHRDNGDQISNWSKKDRVYYELAKTIKNAKFKNIVFSYSDAGIMPKEYIEKVFKRYAKKGTYNFKAYNFVKYKSTRAVNKEIRDNTKNTIHYEWLFCMEKKDSRDIVYQSPFNYIGGKKDLIPLIKKHMPKRKIDTFYDLFGGGFNVGLNIDANKIVYNDINYFVANLLKTLKEQSFQEIYNYILKAIKKYGLAKENKEAYYALRNKYNTDKAKNPLDLYLLMCYGFEHQFRFNSKMEFNNPCGNSSFNDDMLEKLTSYHLRANEINVVFESRSYETFLKEIKSNDFVYVDPPYLNSTGAYNDGKRGFNGWDENQEKGLLDFLSKLDKNGVCFMLSNMRGRNNMSNDLLTQWVFKNKYKMIIDSELTKRNRQYRQEILVINY